MSQIGVIPQNVDKASLVLAVNKLIRANNSGEGRFPIGSLYFNALDDTSPYDILGFGEWERYSKGRVLVGLDEDQTEFDTIGETGGQKGLMKHQHLAPTSVGSPGGTYEVGGNAPSGVYTSPNYDYGGAAPTDFAGTGVNNMNPYITVYIWRRIS